jgi:hypothetical protein
VPDGVVQYIAKYGLYRGKGQPSDDGDGHAQDENGEAGSTAAAVR